MLVEVDDSVLEEAREMNALVEAVLASAPSIHTLDPVETRRQRATGEGIFPAPQLSDRAVNRTIKSRGGDLTLRVFESPNPSAVFLHIHGGGWVLGASNQQDLPLQAFADKAGITVLSVEYRLAPEAPFPLPVEDCVDAAKWVLETGLVEYGVEHVVLGGESAGAHLSMLTILKLRDEGVDISPFVGLNLNYGVYDMGGTPSARQWGDRNLILSDPIVRWFADQAMPNLTTEERQDPSLSPMYADLSGLPAALFSVGTLDLLHDDSVFMHALWQKAGLESQLDEYPESIHGFNGFPSQMTDIAMQRQLDWMLDRIPRS